MEEAVSSTIVAAAPSSSTSPLHVVDPAIAASRLSLDLRVRLLEALVGLDTPAARRVNALEMSVARRGQHIVTSVHEAVEKNGSEAIKRFLENYGANKPLLVPQLSAAASRTNDALAGEELGPHAKAALILDAEQDIRAFERELRDIDILEKRGAAGAGKLAESERLAPRLKKVQKALPELVHSYTELEARVEALLSGYDHYVNTVSQLFVSWNDALVQAEKTVSRMEEKRNA